MFDYLQTQHIVVPLPSDILHIAREERGQARQDAEAVPTAGSAAGLAAVTCNPGAQSLHRTDKI